MAGLYTGASTQLSSACSQDNQPTTRDYESRKSGENDQLDAYRDFQENVTRTDEGRYQVNVPWILGSTLSNSNQEPRRKRLHNVTRNIKQDKDLKKEYEEII